MSVVRMEYRANARFVEITYMGECDWRVWGWQTIGTNRPSFVVMRKSLTSAQSTARTFIATGKEPRQDERA